MELKTWKKNYKTGGIMRTRNKIFIMLLILTLTITSFTGCSKATTNQTNVIGNKGSIILATTTSTENSGLLDYILPKFKEETGIDVKVVAVGTGKALQMGRDGEADVLLVHAKSSEEKFVKEGHGTERFDVMYNDFVIIGPKDDPAKLKEKAKSNVMQAFKILSQGHSKFVSRGDDSGTHKKEKKFWEEAGIEPNGDWYISAGKGMGDVIQMTNELLGYTMSDRATYLSMKDKIELEVVVEGDSKLFNQYGVIPVNPDKNDKINKSGAKAFVDWILSEKTQRLIGEFGKEKFGQPLFTPNAK
ncbi:tungstate transport system substrate-binding protein [Paramaledivibacter caminithermalis DSM 15212]|uniref:Tungstate transport system substrate-binding protein n=2 Tax=Paramaledivibacter TaxID=1884934 RepID=A0A1M6KW94_PARC5|nr:tungstate transport system substrate-binding protein [Paramaledivibacter caminithermalis DSM 15212]